MTWNPEQYLRFADARLRPALDLLARVDLAAPARVVINCTLRSKILASASPKRV